MLLMLTVVGGEPTPPAHTEVHMSFAPEAQSSASRMVLDELLGSTRGLPASGYVRQAQLIPAIIPISSPTLWRWCKTGRFPKPKKLGPRVVAWSCAEVREWLASREV